MALEGIPFRYLLIVPELGSCDRGRTLPAARGALLSVPKVWCSRGMGTAAASISRKSPCSDRGHIPSRPW